MVITYNIIPKNGRFEVYVNGKFLCTAKTIFEAECKIRAKDKEDSK